jgi:choline dehydrogenase-like flavoprotein
MTLPDYSPEAPEDELWDAIVVGTGMGGATIGYALATKGLRVLFLEKGRFLYGGVDRGDGRLPLTFDDSPEPRMDRGHWPLPIAGQTSFGREEFFAPLGCGSGGTTGLYGAQLERFMPADFRPRANFPGAHDATLPETWPIEYAELVPYYERAEALYRVRGTQDPLDPRPCTLLDPPPLSERDQLLAESLRELGLHPYRAHVGCEFVKDCTECGGVLCPRECKNDAGRMCLLPALSKHGAKILVNCTVHQLGADARSVQTVRCRIADRELALRGRVIVLSAGAFMSPLLLLNSRSEHWPNGIANASGLVGRNLMLHTSDFIAVSTRIGSSAEGPKKALALNDFYSGESKLGTFQSVGVPVGRGSVAYYLRNQLHFLPRWLLRLIDPLIRIVAAIAAHPFRNASVFATVVEDLPYHDNRIVSDPTAPNGMRFEYRYPPELRERNVLFRTLLKRRLKPRHRVMVLSGRNNLNYGHVCGTCRFGDDPNTSVLDRENRAHGIDNLFVVDASFFPSSGGTNPSLTIAANALRVADAIERQLAGTDPGRQASRSSAEALADAGR